ncbi:MAG: hypothetical protein ACJA01_004295 [Saprospiraceae bacterium]|jgi:hypothetical protein
MLGLFLFQELPIVDNPNYGLESLVMRDENTTCLPQ